MKKQPMAIQIEIDKLPTIGWFWVAVQRDLPIAFEWTYHRTRRQAVAAATRFLADIHNFNYQFKTR